MFPYLLACLFELVFESEFLCWSVLKYLLVFELGFQYSLVFELRLVYLFESECLLEFQC